MKGYKKLLLGLIGFLLVVSMFATQATRVEAGFPTSELASLPQVLNRVWEQRGKIITSIKNRIVNDLVTRNVAMYMDNLAYNTAMMMDTGAPGSKPLYRTESFGDVIKKTNEAAIGNFIGELSEKEFEDLGLNLCNPSLRNSQFRLTVPLYLIESQAPEKPECSWTQIKNNWQNFDAGLKDDLLVLQLKPTTRELPENRSRGRDEGRENAWQNYKDFWEGFSYSQSDFGLFIDIEKTLAERKLADAKALQAEIDACQDYIAKKTPITKETLASCSKVMNLEKATAEQIFETTADKQKGQYATGNLLDNIGQIMVDAGNRFINTYSARLMSDWLKGGLRASLGYSGGTVSSQYYNSEFSYFSDGGNALEQFRGDLLAKLRGGADIRNPREISIARTNISPTMTQLSSFNLMDDYSVCPTDPDFRHPDNCVVSTPFLSAINSRMTVKQAVEGGILNGDMPFISPEDLLRNYSDDCYLDALCHSNLIKLRKANVVPIGWEMAALRSPITSPVTLQQVMDCFEDYEDGSSQCDFVVSDDYAVDGEPHNPFYHLVDPNWVLKIPEVSCDAYVYSSVLESSLSTNRLQYCADVKTCLREDDNGNCIEGNFGYCAKSENIWRLNGDICEDGELYSGCLTFSNSEYGTQSYIEDTLDYCVSDEVGCRRYSQDLDENEEWLFEALADDDNDLFLSSKAQDCPSSAAGCNQYIVMSADTGANLLPNGDFEIWSSIPAGLPDGYGGNASTTFGLGVDGSNSVLAAYTSGPSDQIACNYDVVMAPNTNYAISVDVMLNPALAGTGPARISLHDCVDINGAYGDLSSPDDSVELDNDNGPYPANEASLLVDASELSSSEYTRITGTVNSGNSVYCGSICVGASYGNDAPHLFDNLKMEIVSQPRSQSAYTDYGVGATVYMYDNTVMCSAEEVGCMGYTPTNGDPMVPAVIDGSDLCPAECVGYSTFAEQLTYFDEVEGLDPSDIEYHNFIVDTAISCPLQEVGCEEFTNLDELANGGEGTEYYNYLRQCVSEDDPNAAVYFTWEGSDSAGYQLKRWLTLESNVNDFGAEVENGPCTNINVGSNDCADTGGAPGTSNIAVCGPSTPSILDDPEYDPNCREFIDTEGNSFFRLQDKVVFASEECYDYRRTETGEVYRAIPSLSFSCAASNNGCREYVGNTENNLRKVFSDNFENGTYSPWESTGSLSISSESLNLNDHSLRGETNENISRPFSNGPIRVDREFELSFWLKNESFLDLVQPQILITTASAGSFAIDMDLGPGFSGVEAGNWHQYRTSVYIAESDIGGDASDITQAALNIRGDNVGITGAIFLDNVVLKEVDETVAVIKNSWNTPVSCDSPYTGYHLGCKDYVDVNGRQYNLKSFNSLCREEAIGCLPAIDTKNSSYPFAQDFNVGDYSALSVAEDSITYLVPNRENYCAANYKGCQAVGLQDRDDPSKADTFYKINDPDTYENTLCASESVNCSAYNSPKGSYYFKDPMYNTCTYKKDVNIEDNIVSGWFSDWSEDEETGLAYGCSDTNESWFDAGGSLEYGDLEALPDTALTCPAEKNLCTGFRDLTDPENCDPSIREGDGLCSDDSFDDRVTCEAAGEAWTDACEVYYYYNSDSIDEGECNGMIDVNGGCMLFYEENYWNAEHDEVVSLYDSQQTYDRNESLGRPLSPLVCGDFDPLCNMDANRLVSVVKDRQCAEWLACKSSAVVWDENTRSYRVICDEIGTCDKYSDDNNVTSCGHWVDDESTVVPLTTEYYQDRSTGSNEHITWSDNEYIGYSVPNMLPISDLVTYNFSQNDEADDTRLVYGHYNASNGLAIYHTSCVDPGDADITSPYDGDVCNGEIGGAEFLGECNDGICWVAPIANQTSTSTFAKGTRGYAVADAPFPKEIEESFNRKEGYSAANKCYDSSLAEEGGLNDCESSYFKVTYGEAGSVKYYPENNDDILSGICLSGQTGLIEQNDGSYKEIECTVDTQYLCNTSFENEDGNIEYRQDGTCQGITKIEEVNHWSGVCLDYDYSTPLLSDGEKSEYYCNQWYPVNKIQGTNSLYNNYREAGYYNESGQDVLYCAIAEPYVLPNDRIYCGSATMESYTNEVCDVLIRVPAGSRVHLGASESDYGKLLNYGYLKTNVNGGEEVFTVVQRDENPDINNIDPSAFDFEPGRDYTNYNSIPAVEKPRTYFERIERTTLPLDRDDKTNQHFKLDDFVLPTDEVITSLNQIVIPPDVLPSIFDATSEYYFWDENVNPDGSWSPPDSLRDPVYGFLAKWGPEYDLSPRPTSWTCDATAAAGGGHDIRTNTPGGDYHGIYSKPGGSQGATGGTYKCKSTGFMGWGDGKYCREVACNPLDHGYYVKAELNPAHAPVICSDTNCGAYFGAANNPDLFDGDPYTYGVDWIDRGWQCLENDDPARAVPGYPANYPTTFQDIRMSSTTANAWTGRIEDMTNIAQCNGDPNCEYIYCVVDNIPAWTDQQYGGIPNASTPEQEAFSCRDMGAVIGNSFEVIETGDFGGVVDSWSFYNVTDLSSCLAHLYDIEEASIFDHPDIDQYNTNISYPMQDYGIAVPKDGVDQALANQLFGWDERVGFDYIEQFPGCINELVHDTQPTNPDQINPLEINCEAVSAIPGNCRFEYGGGFFRRIVCDYYPQEILGTPCDSLNGCYYQCGVITELDAEGDKSWVRTDIWWRSKSDTTNGRLLPKVGVNGVGTPWTTSYYNPAISDYEENTLNSNYYSIEGIPDASFTHFGGSVGSIEEGLVTTRIRYGDINSEAYNTAAVYFYGTSTPPRDLEAWNNPVNEVLDPVRQMVWLFGRAYNLQWNGQEYVEPSTMGSNIPHIDELHARAGAFEAGYSIANPVMGDDYDPRILKVCKDGYCAIEDADGNFLYNAEGITVNNQSLPPEGESYIEVVGRGGSLFTAVKFYYHAHPDHMPIKNIAVNWGDDLTDDLSWNDSPGKYKNSLVDCSDSALLPKVNGEVQTEQGFGGLDRACREGYKVLYHTYEYDPRHPCDGTQPWMPDIPAGEEASCYQPKVRVQDNWVQGTDVVFDGAVVVYKD